jgi:hypothetical protein
MARAFLPVFVCLCAVTAMAQGTPESALAELALAPDLKTASKHYPVALDEVLKQLSPRDMAVAQQKLLPMNQLRGLSIKPKASEDGRAFLLLENSEKKESPVKLTHHISDGLNALVEVETCGSSAEICIGGAQAWMRLEEGDWRLVEIYRSWGGGGVKLDDPDFIEGFRNAERNQNDQKAIETMQLIGNALSNYANTFSDIGFPERLEALGSKEEAKKAESDQEQTAEVADDDSSSSDEPSLPDPEHAGMLDNRLTKQVCEVAGYKIEYTLTRHGDGQTGAYTITATPVKIGETGSKNYFADESRTIRATREDRHANAFDPMAFSFVRFRR